MTTSILTGANLIAGGASAKGRASIAATDPKEDRTLPPFFHEATPDEISAAVEAAGDAFEADRNRSAQERAALLDEIASQIEGLGDVLVNRVHAETGLPEGRVRGERGRTTAQLRLFASLLREGSWVDARIETALLDREPVPRPDLRTASHPIGPVAVFGASNFPLAFSVAGGDTASALAAGCPVVCKAHPAHPGTSELVGRAIAAAVDECGFHPGTFSLLNGAGAEVGSGLVRHPGIQAVGFTGSLAAGRALYNEAAARETPIPVYAEMGSVNPVFLMPEALAQRGAAIGKSLAGSVTLGSGQFCTSPGLVFAVAGDGADGFLAALEAGVKQAGPQIMLHQGIAKGYRSGARRVAETEGVRVLSPGDGAPGGAVAMPAAFVTDARTLRERPHLTEEVFGPSTVVVLCEDIKELVDCASRLSGNLTGTVHLDGSEADAATSLLKALERHVGRVIINGFPTGVEVCHAMQHGGPYPATTAPGTTSVGTAAIRRWVRPVCYQDYPASLLPPELRDENPRRIMRLVNGTYTRDAI